MRSAGWGPGCASSTPGLLPDRRAGPGGHRVAAASPHPAPGPYPRGADPLPAEGRECRITGPGAGRLPRPASGSPVASPSIHGGQGGAAGTGAAGPPRGYRAGVFSGQHALWRVSRAAGGRALRRADTEQPGLCPHPLPALARPALQRPGGCNGGQLQRLPSGRPGAGKTSARYGRGPGERRGPDAVPRKAPGHPSPAFFGVAGVESAKPRKGRRG
jgi:hypothetical protein